MYKTGSEFLRMGFHHVIDFSGNPEETLDEYRKNNPTALVNVGLSLEEREYIRSLYYVRRMRSFEFIAINSDKFFNLCTSHTSILLPMPLGRNCPSPVFG